MNLQIRRARSAEARTLLRPVQERVMSLASVHRNLYQSTSVAAISAERLFDDILRQVLNMGAGGDRRFEVASEVAPIILAPDQAVPVSLWFTEVLTNAMKYAGSAQAGRPAWLKVTLTQDAQGRCVLEVTNSVAPAAPGGGAGRAQQGGDAGEEATGLGGRLLEAFAEQLGGEMHTETGEGWHRATLRFTLAAPDDGGEAASDAPAPAPG